MPTYPRKKFIVDANINRFKEGARVLEDIARYILQDRSLFREIKALKHQVQITDIHRAADEDIGGSEFIEDHHRSSLLDLTHANAIRMQEALRVLEEVDSQQYFKSIRFTSYAIHSKIIVRIKTYLHHQKLQGTYAICDPSKQTIEHITNVIRQNSISICQIRMKHHNKRDILGYVKNLKANLCEETLLIINDHLDIALAEADGVHLGQKDIPVNVVHKLAPENFIIGMTCHNMEEAKQAVADHVNYISVGCLFPTQTKLDTTPVSLETLARISKNIRIPVCAIGGINPTNIHSIQACGVNMIAMYHSLWESPSII